MVQQVESCKQFIYVCLLGGGGGIRHYCRVLGNNYYDGAMLT